MQREIPIRAESRKSGVWRRVGRWAAASCMFPCFYIWLPVSCCFVSPVVKTACPKRTTEFMEEGEACAANMTIGGCCGCLTLVTCCFCCGCCCTKDPDDVFEEI